MAKVVKNKLECEKCGGTNLKRKSANGNIMAVGLILTVAGIFIPVIGWFVLIPIGLVMLFTAFLFAIAKKCVFKKLKLKCLKCGKVNRLTRKQYKKFN